MLSWAPDDASSVRLAYLRDNNSLDDLVFEFYEAWNGPAWEYLMIGKDHLPAMLQELIDKGHLALQRVCKDPDTEQVAVMTYDLAGTRLMVVDNGGTEPRNVAGFWAPKSFRFYGLNARPITC